MAGCALPRVNGAFVCATHLGEKRRCEGRVAEWTDPDTGEMHPERQCRKSARPGTVTCTSHGGNGAATKAVVARAPVLTTMQRFVQPYRGDLDPITAFELEFRRTYGRILWLEEQIADLAEEDLTWGKTKEEEIGASEFSGSNVTYEAKTHVYEEMLWRERKHFLDLEKVWLAAKMDEKRLNIMRDHITYTYTKVMEAARVLGHDVTDPDVRDRLMRLFSGGDDDAASARPQHS